MVYKIRLTAKANKVYSEANTILKKKIAKCLKILQETPKNYPQIKALKGEFAGKYRFRIGDYRVIYSIVHNFYFQNSSDNRVSTSRPNCHSWGN
jgi:mRNA interferase RelE/StbE